MDSSFPKSANFEYNTLGKDWIITDIHGCLNTFKKLLEKIDYSQSDRLFLLGDLVNKGPWSIETLDFLINLEREGYQILKVMGNHDLIWLELMQGKIKYSDSKIINQMDLNVEALKNETHAEFLNRSYYYVQLEDNYLVHAGFNFKSDKPFEEYIEMTKIRDWELDTTLLEEKKVIHGHVAHPFVKIYEAVENKHQKVPLDNGCVYIGEWPGTGRLLALEAKSFELVSQKNIDQKSNSLV